MKGIQNYTLGTGIGQDQAIFRILNQTLVFNNLTATVTDSRISATDAILVYYANESVAQAAGMTSTWTDGSVTFTAQTTPSDSIVVNIYDIKPALANVWDSISAQEVSYGSSTVKDALDNKVSKSGDVMSGTLSLQKSGEIYVEIQNTNKSLAMALDVTNNGNQGLWSNGYNDGTFHSSGKWIINRESNGNVSVNGTTIPSNGGTVALTSDTTPYIDLTSYGNKSMSDAWDLINIYDRTITGKYSNGGTVMFMAYKYNGSQYGMMIGKHFAGTNIIVLSVDSGTKSIRTI